MYNLPQDTGMTDLSADFGPLRVGSHVIINRHRPVKGSYNWIPSMDKYIGRKGVVSQFSGVDSRGCPCVKCSFGGDACTYAFRIRDLTLVDCPSASAPPEKEKKEEKIDFNLPQGTGMKRDQAKYGALHVGSHVIIHKHRKVNGDNNWKPQMDKYINREGVVAELCGVDKCGCPVVRCSFDDEKCRFFFRIRDMTLISE